MRSNRQVRVLVSSFAALLVVALVACSDANTDKAGSAERVRPTVLVLASNNGRLDVQIEAYINEVERLSSGTLRIEFTESWREGEAEQEKGLIEDVQAGKVDMAWVGARAFDSVGVTSFQALVAPFLIDSYELEARVFAEGIPVRMLESLDAIGITGIGVLPGPLRKMTGISHPFVSPSDFTGAVVGTSGGALAEQTFRALGATPKKVPSNTSLDGLDALDYQLSAIYNPSYYEVAGNVTANVNLWPRPLVILMQADRFGALAAEQQDVLRTAAIGVTESGLAASRAEETDAGTSLCRTGIAVVAASSSDLAALNQTVAPVYAQLEQTAETKGYLDEIRALKIRAQAPSDSFECSAGASAGDAEESTPIDGVYEVRTTVDDLVAAGDPPIPDNYGSWTYVFDRGRFAFTQENQETADACSWGYGTYEVKGDRVEWSFLGGGSRRPNGAANKLGEFFVFTWSLYRDVLTLTAVPGKSPTPFMVKPWRRTGATPSISVLDHRCPPPDSALWPDGDAQDPATPTEAT